jgi:methylated-DNA-[protein]-cysteine S-methyltransferase
MSPGLVRPSSASVGGIRIVVARLGTPIGGLTLFVHRARLCGVAFEGSEAGLRAWLTTRYGAFVDDEQPNPAGLASRLTAYFAGDLRALDAIPVETGGTAFQQRAWLALREIPLGTTTSYGELAARLGSPRAVRAVGLANGRNPIPLVLPCHRVIGADGSLTGYGGGLERKRWLLVHEGALLV